MAVLVAFLILIILTAANEHRLADFRAKNWQDWILDGVGLFFQGILIPVLQIAVVYQLYDYCLPIYQGCLHFHPIAAFFLSFVGVDYLYYWNHRLLHTQWFWSVHKVHHTVTEMDVLGTSRNTLWSSFFILYLWVHALLIYLLADPGWYVAGVSLTSVLDLWRHSAIAPLPHSLIYRFLSPWLILPQEHAWHHSRDSQCWNYGANLKFWDKLHGTYYKCSEIPDSLGIEINLNLTQMLIWPFRDNF